MLTRFGRCLALLTPALALVPGGGCATDKLAMDNFQQIKPHVTTEAEVITLLGEPDSKLHEYWVYQRTDKHLSVFIEFDSKGQVTRTQWVDAMESVWRDTQEAKPKATTSPSRP